MSWPSVIVLAPTERSSSFEDPIRALGVFPDPATGAERLHWQEYSYYLDLTGGILADFEQEELEHIAELIGEPRGFYVSGQSMDAIRALLGHLLPGFHGLVDTDHGDILPAHEFLGLLGRYPRWDWRRVPRADVGRSGENGPE
ncbi:hypothetical protein [Streptomyces sp. NPDC005494]|uniref:hypothetical protein n=1 Tax=unclassified Streptomyces TaxID=2593676 RepID=UPI0036BD4929